VCEVANNANEAETLERCRPHVMNTRRFSWESMSNRKCVTPLRHRACWRMVPARRTNLCVPDSSLAPTRSGARLRPLSSAARDTTILLVR
jgi:hypothetical protein